MTPIVASSAEIAAGNPAGGSLWLRDAGGTGGGSSGAPTDRPRRITPIPTREMPQAIVVGGNLNALGVARSLRKGRVPVTVLATSWREPAAWSRGCRPMLLPQLHGTELIDALLSLRRRMASTPVLILTDEMAVFTVSEHRQLLEQHFRFTLPSADMVDALSDKARFHALAEATGLPVPRSIAVEKDADIAKVAQLMAPLIIKPANKSAVYLGHAERIRRADTIEEAQSLCREMLPGAGSLIVQEWIPGADTGIVFCLFFAAHDGQIVSLFTGRKLRCDPPDIGSTGICVSAPEASALVEPMTRRFAQSVGFAGIGSMEFKWHSGRGEFLAIEPTVGRTDWQEEIATLCGENIALTAYGHALGLQLPRSTKRRKAAWRASIRQRWPGEVPRTADRIYDGLWRWGDPLPAACDLADTGLRQVERLLARLRGTSSAGGRNRSA